MTRQLAQAMLWVSASLLNLKKGTLKFCRGPQKEGQQWLLENWIVGRVPLGLQ